MQLDSYLEIFLTFYGWAFANIMGEVLAGTGLIALPFGLIVFNAWREAKESAAGGASVVAVIEAVQVRLLIALFVFSLCFATTPLSSLSSITLSYTPPATTTEPAPQTATQAGSGSTYDAAMADAVNGSMSTSGGLTQVPMWWMAVMGYSSGVNSAVRAALGNSSRDLRMLEDQARNAAIQDPRLLADIQRFHSECFIPARSRYLRMDKDQVSSTGQAILAGGNTEYGPTDVDWMGSQFFRSEPGFYSRMRAYAPVPGFAVDLSRDTDYIASGASGDANADSALVNPDWGRPTCNEWWLDSARGIRQQIVAQSEGWQSIYTSAKNMLTWASDDAARDAVAKLGASKARPQFVDSARIMGNDYDVGTTVAHAIGQAVSTFTVGKKLLDMTVEFVPLVTALPMVQAALLMGIYMFLPLIVVFSGYDLKLMLYGALGIFTVKFWASMWYIARWLDAHLIAAMYPGLDGNAFLSEVRDVVGLQDSSSYKRMILNIVLMSMFVGFPLLWSGMMGWIGARIGGQLSQAMERYSASGKGLPKVPSLGGRGR